VKEVFWNGVKKIKKIIVLKSKWLNQILLIMLRSSVVPAMEGQVQRIFSGHAEFRMAGPMAATVAGEATSFSKGTNNCGP
jgi:hypothetical protein